MTIGGPTGGGSKPSATSAPPAPQAGAIGSAVGNAVGGAVTPATPATSQQIGSLYHTLLGRAPDGMASGWSGMSSDQVTKGIQNSPEFQSRLALSGQAAPDPNNIHYANQPGTAFAKDMQDWSNAQGAPTAQWAADMQNWGNNIGAQMRAASAPSPTNPLGGMSLAQYAALDPRWNGNPAPPSQTPQSTAGQPFGSTYQATMAAHPEYAQLQNGNAFSRRQLASNGMIPQNQRMPMAGGSGGKLGSLGSQGNGKGGQLSSQLSGKFGGASPQVPR